MVPHDHPLYCTNYEAGKCSGKTFAISKNSQKPQTFSHLNVLSYAYNINYGLIKCETCYKIIHLIKFSCAILPYIAINIGSELYM